MFNERCITRAERMALERIIKKNKKLGLQGVDLHNVVMSKWKDNDNNLHLLFRRNIASKEETEQIAKDVYSQFSTSLNLGIDTDIFVKDFDYITYRSLLKLLPVGAE